MNTRYKDFCENYKKKLTLDKDIQENKLDWMEDYRDRINFKVTVFTSHPHHVTFPLGNYRGTELITLDSEDLEYLYNKYLKKLEDEMNKNIESVKDKYKDILSNE